MTSRAIKFTASPGYQDRIIQTLMVVAMFVGFFSPNFVAASTNCDFDEVSRFQEINSLHSFIHIEVDVFDQRKWAQNAIQSIIQFRDNTRQKYMRLEAKKKFKAQVLVHYSFGSCKFEAEVRLHGDQGDHLQFRKGEIYSSLDVRLNDGSIGNITKFKLFLPEARNGDNEIILTTILEELEFLAPRTRYVDARLNGSTVKMIFQEKVSKEFLEYHGRREAPLFEGDERFVWGFGGYKLFSLETISLSRLVNWKWAQRGDSSMIMSLSGHAILQDAYQEYTAAVPPSCGNGSIFLNFDRLANGNQMVTSRWQLYELLLAAANAGHALRVGNRKFYFNPFEQAFEPIYYDGNAKFLSDFDQSYFECMLSIYSANFRGNVLHDLMNIALELNADALLKRLRLKGYQGSNDAFEKILQKFKKNLIVAGDVLSSAPTNAPLSQELGLELLARNISNVKGVGYASYDVDQDPATGGQLFICPPQTSCENPMQLLEIARGDSPKQLHHKLAALMGGRKLDFEDPSKEFPIVFWGVNRDAKMTNFKEVVVTDALKVRTLGNVSTSYSTDSKELTIKFNDELSRAVISSSELKDLKINLVGFADHSLEDLADSEQRFNEFGLTGCLTIYGSSFQGLEVSGSHLHCEDALNIVSSSGTIERLSFSQAASDAVDFDFSDLTVNNLKVAFAGNDCVDVSAGVYVLQNVEVANCNDKAVSVGEKAQLDGRRLSLTSSFIGLSVKDSSFVAIDELNTKNVTVCVEARNKKQEFNGAIAEIEKVECNDELMERGEVSGSSNEVQAWRDRRSKINFGVANSAQPTIAVYENFTENDDGQWMPAVSN